MPSSRTAHNITFLIGIIFVLLAFYLAFFVRGSFFYTSFTFGSWLVLDFIDYRLNHTSFFAFFYNRRHRKAFFFLFLMSFFACFTVDFVWGVRILKMWEWINYGPAEFVRMYLVMNITFVLSMYELYRIVQTLLRPYVAEKNLLSLRTPYNKRKIIYVGVLCVGILFLVSPLYLLAFNIYSLTAYIEIFPFLSISFICDAITFFTGGSPVLEQLVRLNRLRVVSILTTVVIAFVFTEGLNLFGREWKYLRMPFYNLQILTVPVSVLIGWIPLVVGLICMVNMVKHLDYITTTRRGDAANPEAA